MSGSRDFIIGVLVGSAVGAAAALLYAPQAGAETRERIREKSNEVADRTSELTQQAKDRAAELARQAQSRTSELKQQAQGRISDLGTQAKTKVGDISTQAQSVLDKGKEAIDHQKEALRTAVEAGKQAYVEKQSELQQDVAADTQPAVAPTLSSAV